MNDRMIRRRFLEGLGASAFGAAVGSSILRRAFADGPPSPRRLILLGAYSWQPATYLPSPYAPRLEDREVVMSGPDVAPEPVAEWPEMYAAAAAYLDRAVLVDGCRVPELEGFNNSHGAGTSWLSARRPVGDKGMESVASGITLDEFLGQQLRAGAPYPVIRCGLTGDSYGGQRESLGGIFAAGPDQDLPYITNPRKMAETYFPDAGGEAEAMPRAARFRPVRDRLLGEFRALNDRLAASERGALESYERAVVEFDEQQQRLASLSCDGPTLPEDRLSIEAELASLVQQAGLALRCGLTNVVAISIGQQKHHNKHHPVYDNAIRARARVEENRVEPKSWSHSFAKEHWAKFTDAYLVHHQVNLEALVSVMDMLSAAPEGEGTMMDNTAVVFMPGNSIIFSGHHVESNTFPALLIAGRNLGFRTDGRFMRFTSGHRRYGGGEPRHLADFYRSLALGLGADPTGFRDDAPNSQGSIPEILAG
jgi:hypothetical protein